MPSKDSPRIFISYSPVDSWKEAESLARTLTAAGLDVWFDRWTLVPGEEWTSSTLDALASAKAVLLLIGQKGVSGSQSKELRLAVTSQAKNETLRIIPVLLPGSNAESIPSRIRDLVPIDLRATPPNEREISRLISTLDIPEHAGPIAQERLIAQNLRLAADLNGAAEHYERALRIAKTAYGDEHPLVADLLRSIAEISFEQGDLAKATSLLNEALAIELQGDTDKSATFAATLNQTAVVLYAQGRLDEAMSRFQEALAIAIRRDDQRSVATHTSNIGSILRDFNTSCVH